MVPLDSGQNSVQRRISSKLPPQPRPRKRHEKLEELQILVANESRSRAYLVRYGGVMVIINTIFIVINIDLMAGMDGQSVASFQEDVRFVLGLQPDSMNLNGFRPVPRTAWFEAGNVMHNSWTVYHAYL